MDLPITPFEELIGLVSDHEFEDQNLEPHPDEWSGLDETLYREEAEAEAEAEREIDDWWISD